VLNSTGVDVEPQSLVPRVYLPERRGSLQIELMSASRRYRRLPYRIDPDLHDLLAEVRAGHPVLVLQNLGIRLLPVWHYAVVVGYDPANDSVVLRSGTQRRRVMPAVRFMASWERADKWAIVILQPGQMPGNPDPARYLSAAAAMETVDPPAAQIEWIRAAVEQWPENALVQFALGNALYANARHREAAGAFRKALDLDPGLLAARNNLAHLLNEQGCPHQALLEIDRALQSGVEIDAGLEKTLRQTRSEIQEKTRTTAGEQPASCP
jgi:tetratricopeptide (TPR) repeat protein